MLCLPAREANGPERNAAEPAYRFWRRAAAVADYLGCQAWRTQPWLVGINKPARRRAWNLRTACHRRVMLLLLCILVMLRITPVMLCWTDWHGSRFETLGGASNMEQRVGASGVNA